MSEQQLALLRKLYYAYADYFEACLDYLEEVL